MMVCIKAEVHREGELGQKEQQQQKKQFSDCQSFNSKLPIRDSSFSSWGKWTHVESFSFCAGQLCLRQA